MEIKEMNLAEQIDFNIKNNINFKRDLIKLIISYKMSLSWKSMEKYIPNKDYNDKFFRTK